MEGENISRPPRSRDNKYIYNENDDVNSLEHELVFGIDMCFDIEAILCI